MSLLLSMMLFLAALVPTKSWFAPAEPINVGVKAPADASLFLTDFTGRSIESQGSVSIGGGERTVDLKALFPTITTPGTYVLYLVPKDAATKDFAGTPLVVSVREDRRQGAPPGPMVVRLSPLRFAMLTTEKGPPLTIAFYYDVAPHTTENFLSLAEGGFYDGLTFHRIVKDFVLQGGDPRGDGTGGPGYTVNAEFNERPHHEGVLSMARGGDPNEAGGAMPRAEFANSAGSQFFVCLNYANTQQLDRRYTAFAKIVTGTEAVQALAAVPLAEGSDRPKDPPKIVKVEVRPVTAQENPYPRLIEQIQPNLIKAPTSAPTSSPTSSPAEAPPRAP